LKKKVQAISHLLNIALGAVLVADKLFWHRITWRYPEWLAWLDPIFGHHILGGVLIGVGVLALWSLRSGK